MKPIHKRIYTVLPRVPTSSSYSPTTSSISRVRSNSASSARSLYTVPSSLPLSFFETPATPSPGSRPGNSNVVISSRLAAEVKADLETQADSPYSQSFGQNSAQTHSGGPPPYSLALTSGPSDSSSPNSPSHFKPFFPYPSFAPALTSVSKASGDLGLEPGPKRQRTRYHLDVGAYGIPKHSRGACIAGRDGHGKLGPKDALHMRLDNSEALNSAVQVGEDAYFVRGNAMGVADGVGGWSRLHGTVNSGEAEPSPSALFARRLMHYCSEEVDAAYTHPGSTETADAYATDTSLDVDSEDVYVQLEDSLEELEEGLDVLMILEKAYEKTMQAHVYPEQDAIPHEEPFAEASHPCEISSNNHCLESYSQSIASHFQSPSSWTSILSPHPKQSVAPPKVPLLQGSSTALVAVLEHPPARVTKQRRSSSLFAPRPRRVDGSSSTSERGAIIKIAHLGDCMGMLIRGEEIVWRTEEMWWNFNTPVQLGPSSPTRPRDAHVFTVPVEADDILILASDGLSDNLWDEDVLDEVIRFRRPYVAGGSWQEPSPATSPVKGGFGRSTLAAMLSEALCSRARRVAEKRVRKGREPTSTQEGDAAPDFEIPFGRRAREHGRSFHGGKPDDISVLVAIISPVETLGLA